MLFSYLRVCPHIIERNQKKAGDGMSDERELILSELERVRAMLYKNEQLFEVLLIKV